MSTRITETTTAAAVLQGIETSYDQFQQLSTEIASGVAVNKPSDNPAGSVQIMSYNAEMTRLGQYQTNGNDGLAWLGSADNVLSSAVTQLQRVQQLALQASNGTTDANGRAAIADEIDNVRQGLLADANTTYLGRPIFGGTTGGSAAYDSAGNYLGDNGAVTRTVAVGTTVQVNLTGTAVFGGGSSSVFSALSQLSADLRSSNPSQVANIGTADSSAIDQALTLVEAGQATVGSRYNEIKSLQTQVQDRQTTLSTALAGVQDVDLAKAETELATHQLNYQAALQATAKVLSLSLVDFLR